MSATYLLRLGFELPKLMAMGARRGISNRALDVGYLVHCQMGELFGENAPGVFRSDPGRGRFLEVLAYSDHPADLLRQHAREFCKPEADAACDWSAFAGKEMPEKWAAGRTLNFEVRACPTKRMNAAGPKHRKGAEVDVFLAECWAAGDAVPVEREHVYRDWLAHELGREGACELKKSELRSFKRERLVRRTQGASRQAVVLERPDALLSGTLEVKDPEAFARLLRRGLGRHRAFGFGMLLLRPGADRC